MSTFKDGYEHVEAPDTFFDDHARLPDSIYDDSTFALIGIATAATKGVHTDDADTTGVAVLDVGPMEELQDAVEISDQVSQKIVPLCQWVPLFQTMDEITPENPAFQTTINAVIEAYTAFTNSADVKNMETFQRQFRQQQQDIRDAAESEDKDSYVPPKVFPGARGGYSVHHGIIVCVPDKRPDANPLVPLIAVLGGQAHTEDAIKKAQNYSSLHMTSHSIGVVRTRRWIYPQISMLRSITKREQVHFEDPNLNRMFQNERMSQMRVAGDDSLVELLKKEHADSERKKSSAADGGSDVEVPEAEGEPAAGAGGDAGGDPGSA